MRKAGFIALVALALGAGAEAGVTVITQWDFNGTSAATVPGGTSSPTPSTGAGTASLFGGTTGAFNSGTSDGGSSDPVITTPTNYAWGTANYAPQGTQDNGRGVQFNVSTLGVTDGINISFDVRGSGTASKFIRLMYSLDGTNFSSTGLGNDGVYEIMNGTAFNNGIAFNLSGIAGASNNANFAFRIVATFAPGTSAYAPVSSASYGTGGTLRYDMVTVFIPAPGAFALLGAAAFVSRRRRA